MCQRNKYRLAFLRNPANYKNELLIVGPELESLYPIDEETASKCVVVMSHFVLPCYFYLNNINKGKSRFLQFVKFFVSLEMNTAKSSKGETNSFTNFRYFLISFRAPEIFFRIRPR